MREAARVLAGCLDFPDDEPEHDHHEQDRDEEQHRQRGAESPLQRVAELVRDQIGIEGPVGAANQLRGRVVAHHRNEGEHEAGDDAGARGRQRYRDQPSPRPCAEVCRGIQHCRVDALDRYIGREKGEGEQQVDEGDHDRRPAEAEKGDRFLHETGAHQRPVDQSLVAEHGEPGKNPDQIAGPEWNDREQDPKQPLRRPDLDCHEIGEGKAQKHRERRGQRDEPERAQQHPPIGFPGEEPGVVFERPLMDDPSVFGRPEGVYDEDGKGQEEADRHREDRRKWQQGILEAAMAQSGEPRGQGQRTPGAGPPCASR